MEAVAELARLEGTSLEAVGEEAAHKEATRHDSARQMAARREAPQPAAGSVSPRDGTLRNRRLINPPIIRKEDLTSAHLLLLLLQLLSLFLGF